MINPTDPAVLWRMRRGDATAHATIFPGDTHTTITWFFDDVMDRAENYDSLELALARAEQIRGVLMREGWSPLQVVRYDELNGITATTA